MENELVDILMRLFRDENKVKNILIKCYSRLNQGIHPIGPKLRIVRDVQGVGGLHVAYDIFTENAEKRYFNQPNLWPPTETLTGTHSRSGTIASLFQFPRELFELLNAIQDSNFINPLVFPDYCLCLSYPLGSTFSAHFDSRYRWGKYIIGVNLGAPCLLTMTLPKYPEKTEKIILPRRSIYVFSGDSRYIYKHSISKINSVGSNVEAANKEWNPTSIRRSFTLRCTKVYETVVLEHRLSSDGHNPTLDALIRENKLYPPRGDYGSTKTLTSSEIKQERLMAEFQLQIVNPENVHARMSKNEALW